MNEPPSPNPSPVVIHRREFPALLEALRRQGYHLKGPVLRDGAITYGELETVEDLPVGHMERQLAGSSRLERRSDSALFGFASPAHSWKQYLMPPRVRLCRITRESSRLETQPANPTAEALAFVGVRACELHALAIQDKIFLGGAFVDTVYRQRRESAFIIAVNCAQAGGNCFCASMNTGPRARFGFDLALTELLDGQRHDFLVETGSARGEQLLKSVPHAVATVPDQDQAEAILRHTASQMGRRLNTDGLKELLYAHFEHPRWDDVASRCLTCGNCTMVCPTCFCTTVEDVTDLAGAEAERWRTWDSCFSVQYSYIHGGSIRATPKSRYRQWLTHKLGTWIDQFGVPGCVGCGRCITWCPAAIDLTEEAAALRQTDGAMRAKGKHHEDH